MSEPEIYFKWDAWMKPSYPKSFEYTILSGGPTPHGYLTKMEVKSDKMYATFFLTSKEFSEFMKELLSWIRTWWDPKQRLY